MTDGLKDTHREAIIGVIAANDRVERAVLFGSRATGTNSVSSDVDIALFGDRLTLTDQSRLAAALDEIPMAQSVDLILYASINNRRLLEHIHRNGVEWYRRIGKTIAFKEKPAPISDDWRTVELGDCVVVNNPTYSPTEAWPFINYLDTGNITENRVLEIQNLIAGRDRLPSRARRKVLPGDIVYSTVRPNLRHFGLLKRVPTHFLASTGFAVMRGRHDVAHTDFIYWFLTQEKVVKYLQTIAEHSTSAYPSIRPADIQSLSLDLPPLQEQRAIAHILGTLDDKIELNRRMNATLEAMARALFRSWFVDFDPVRAKMEGRDTGLPKKITDLFSDRLVDSELGKIPDGWTVGTLGDVAAAPRSGIDPGQVADDTPYIGLEHMPRRSVALTDWGRAGSVSSTKTAFENRDILFGKLRPYFHKVGIAPENGVCSTDIVVLKARMVEWSAFVLACVSSSDFVSYASQTSTGTKMPRTSWRTMSKYEMCRPAVAVAAAFQHFVSPMLERIVANVHESRVLGRLRDALLPKLVSGEVRVNGVALASACYDRLASVGTHRA